MGIGPDIGCPYAKFLTARRQQNYLIAMSSEAVFFAAFAAQVVIYVVTALFASRSKKAGKAPFLLIMIALTLLPLIDYAWVAPSISDDGLAVYGLLRLFVFTIALPVVTALAFAYRINDAGLDRNAVYLGAIPTLSFFAALYLVFQDKAYPTAEPGH
jgi:hypothetical protein